MRQPEQADLKTKLGPTTGHFAPGRHLRLAGKVLMLALLVAMARSPSLAQDRTPASTPEIYVNTELLERLANEDPTARPTAEVPPDSLLQSSPSWELESRLYVLPSGQAGPAEPALAPPAPSVLTSELKALKEERPPPVREPARLVKPREAPPRPSKTTVAKSPGGDAAPSTSGSKSQAPRAQAAKPVPVPAQPNSEAEKPAAVPPQVTAELQTRSEDAAPDTGPETLAPEAQTAAQAPLPTKSSDEVEVPSPPQVTAELKDSGGDRESDTSGTQILVPEPPDTAPPALPPPTAREIESPATTPPPGAAAQPDPEPEAPVAATGADAPPPAAQILDELAEAAEREAPRARKVVAPPVPEPPPALAQDAVSPKESVTVDEQAPAAPPPPAPEEQLGLAAATPKSGDRDPQIAARPTAEAPLEGQILFEAGSSDLLPEARGILEGLAERMKASDAEGVELRAYATGRYSRRLSLSRGLVAQGYLEKLGVDPDTVFVRALGDKSTDGPSERIDFELITP